MVEPNESTEVAIYFSEFFGLDPEVIEGYGAFDVSLISDLPLFVDPFMLFTSKKERYQELHRGVIQYLQFLLEKTASGPIESGLLTHWFRFKEVKENWLGFASRGNTGHGLGRRFAGELYVNLSSVFKDFGNEKVTRGSHLEKLCLISRGVGRDNISDFTVCLIKGFLLEYSQELADRFLDPDQIWTGDVERTRFDYTTETWTSEQFRLPKFGDSFVILSPKDLLRREETWINRSDLVRNFEQVAASVPDEVLRHQLNNYLRTQLIYPADSTDKEKKEKRDKTIEEAMRQFPEIIEYYI